MVVVVVVVVVSVVEVQFKRKTVALHQFSHARSTQSRCRHVVLLLTHANNLEVVLEELLEQLAAEHKALLTHANIPVEFLLELAEDMEDKVLIHANSQVVDLVVDLVVEHKLW